MRSTDTLFVIAEPTQWKTSVSEVNHAASNACAHYAEDSKGEALSEADLGLRSSQSRRNHERTKKYKESQKDSYIILFISR